MNGKLVLQLSWLGGVPWIVFVLWYNFIHKPKSQAAIWQHLPISSIILCLSIFQCNSEASSAVNTKSSAITNWVYCRFCKNNGFIMCQIIFQKFMLIFRLLLALKSCLSFKAGSFSCMKQYGNIKAWIVDWCQNNSSCTKNISGLASSWMTFHWAHSTFVLCIHSPLRLSNSIFNNLFITIIFFLNFSIAPPGVTILFMGPRGAPTTCHNQHGASRSYSFGQIWADREQIFVLIPMWFLHVLAFLVGIQRACVIYPT